MAPKLYGFNLSPSVRAVWLTAKALNLELENINIDVFKKEQLSPEFVKINPQHTIPTLDDNGVILWDSHTIMIYLVDKYGKDSTLYPKDLAKRAKVNRLLFFDSGDLFAAHVQCCRNGDYGRKKIPESDIKNLETAVGHLNVFLQNSKYVAGDDITIADFSLWTSLSNAQIWITLDEKKYPNVIAWKEVMNGLPYADLNLIGAKIFKDMMQPV